MVTGAALYLKSRTDVDSARVGLWGGSYGGYLTALGLARASDMFAAGVDFHGVHDWNEVIQNFTPGYDPGAAGNCQAGVRFVADGISKHVEVASVTDSWRR